MFLLGPKPHAGAGCSAAGAPGPLVGGRLADFFDKQRVDAAIGIVTRDPSKAAVNHQPDAVNGKRSLGNVGGHHDFALSVTRDGGVLVVRRQLAVEWKKDEALRSVRVPNGFDRLRDFKTARHEHQYVARAAGPDVTAKGIGRLLPDGPFVGVTRLRQ